MTTKKVILKIKGTERILSITNFQIEKEITSITKISFLILIILKKERKTTKMTNKNNREKNKKDWLN